MSHQIFPSLRWHVMLWLLRSSLNQGPSVPMENLGVGAHLSTLLGSIQAIKLLIFRGENLEKRNLVGQ